MSAGRPGPATVLPRTVVLVLPDADLRHRLAGRLQGMRWTVLEASGGAEAMGYLQDGAPEAMLVDHWLPDLDAGEFREHASTMHPGMDVLLLDGSVPSLGQRSPRRNELLHALREELDAGRSGREPERSHGRSAGLDAMQASTVPVPPTPAPVTPQPVESHEPIEVRMHLPEIVGDSPPMRALARMVRMVAGHNATVLIQGETGTGKELVARSVHRLSPRVGKAFAVLNCAAIPEHLLEAELFGHTRGAFTGAITSRTGRIEAAHGGTLFLDEIGEMPLPLQAKMLRFLESGEIQRVGDNDVFRVDVRIVAATHRALERNAAEHLFRLDLYYRLAVFPVNVPTLRDRREDIPMMVEHFLRLFGEHAPRCTLEPAALEVLMRYHWPGNVRQLSHCLQRGCILAGATQRIGLGELELPTG